MRAPKNEATGTSGESEVKAEFEQLGWEVMSGSNTISAPTCCCYRVMSVASTSEQHWEHRLKLAHHSSAMNIK